MSSAVFNFVHAINKRVQKVPCEKVVRFSSPGPIFTDYCIDPVLHYNICWNVFF